MDKLDEVKKQRAEGLYSIDKKRAIHVYYTDEKYFYFFNENEFCDNYKSIFEMIAG